MRANDIELEIALRAEASDTATQLVIADFYESRGQPTRAKMWRIAARSGQSAEREAIGLPPDLYADTRTRSYDPRRNAMIWIACCVIGQREAARAFGISSTRIRQIASKQDRQIFYRHNREARLAEKGHPTMAATARLAAAGALTPCHIGDFGDVPPDTWPAVSRQERRRQRDRRPAP